MRHTARALCNALSVQVIFSLDCWKHDYMTIDTKITFVFCMLLSNRR